MKRCAIVRVRSARRVRTCPWRSLRIDGLPLKVRDHEYCPVTVQVASSARLATNSDRSRTAGSGSPAAAKICSISFLLLAASLMAASFTIGKAPTTFAPASIILPIDMKYDIYSQYEFEF